MHIYQKMKLKKETLTEHTRRCQKYWFNIVEAKHIETVFIKFEQLYMGDITNEPDIYLS